MSAKLPSYFRIIQHKKSTMVILCLFSMVVMTWSEESQGDYLQTKLSDNVMIFFNPDLGSQLVIQSKMGLIIFDSFWSETTARKFKKEISKTIHRDDFAYVINMVDRIDMIGGNAAYPEAQVIGHSNILAKYNEAGVAEAEQKELIEMWRHKEELATDRLKKMNHESERAKRELRWINKCQARADELETGFSLIPPHITYSDRMTVDLGNLTLHLRWFGEAGNYCGETIAVVPEENLAVLSKAILYPKAHLAPYPHPDFKEIHVSRWIDQLEEILEGDHAVDRILLSDYEKVISKEIMLSHLHYIRKLWNSINKAVAEGKNLKEIQDQLSLENEFSFVKNMQVYKNQSDNWIRPQHEVHIKHFYRQILNQQNESFKSRIKE